MKTLLLSTDFSATGDHAVNYGYRLAKCIRANVVLCHAFLAPAEMPQAGLVVWPMDTYEDVLEDYNNELQKRKNKLENSVEDDGFTPATKLVNETGPVAQVIAKAVSTEKADMVIIGTHHEGINTLLLGNHSNTLIDHLDTPLLLVPPKARLQSPKKVVFASDFKDPDGDFKALLSLVPLIKKLDAELFITHIEPAGQHRDHQFWLSEFLKDVAHKSAYAKIFAKVIQNDDRDSAWEQICSGRETDLLVMVHHNHGFFEEIFKGSYTKKTAKNTSVPLLVLHPTE